MSVNAINLANGTYLIENLEKNSKKTDFTQVIDFSRKTKEVKLSEDTKKENIIKVDLNLKEELKKEIFDKENELKLVNKRLKTPMLRPTGTRILGAILGYSAGTVSGVGVTALAVKIGLGMVVGGGIGLGLALGATILGAYVGNKLTSKKEQKSEEQKLYQQQETLQKELQELHQKLNKVEDKSSIIQ